MFKLKYWIMLLASQSLFALTTFEVTLDTDNNPGGYGEPGDFRYFLNFMNQSLNTTPDDFAIIFNGPMTIQLNGILPVINNSSNPVNITIGNPTFTVTLDGNNGTYSGFFIPTGNVTVQNMIFKNMTAKGGNGGDGISGGGGGMGAGGAIYAPQSFLYGANPSVSLINVSINNCSAIGGNGGNYSGSSLTGNEGGGGGGGFGGNGGSILTTGSTAGGGGGGFGGNGGDVLLSVNDPSGGGGGGGGGIGSLATLGTLTNLGHGGSDNNIGMDGNGYGLSITAGTGGGGHAGGANAGGGGGGGDSNGGSLSGGGGGGSAGSNGLQAQGNIPAFRPGLINSVPSGGNGGDGAGSGGAGLVAFGVTNAIDGEAANAGYGGGGGGGAGTGSYDTDYTVQGGLGGVGGGGGGGGVNFTGFTASTGGNSQGGAGGGGGGPANGTNTQGGVDIGNLGGGAGGFGANSAGFGYGGGGGGGGSGLGAAIFVDSNLNLTIQAFSARATTFDTSNNTTQGGSHGVGGPGGSDGLDGSAHGNSIFLRTGSTLTFFAPDIADVLTLGSGVAFTDDTVFGIGGTSVQVKGDGTVIYEGSTDYQGSVIINNAEFKVNGLIDHAPISVCRNSNASAQRGRLSGTGSMTGDVFVNTGTIAPDAGATLSLGSLTLNPASLVQIKIDGNNSNLVAVTNAVSLAGTLQIDLTNAVPGLYTILTSSGITGTFESISFTGTTPRYTLSYIPEGAPTSVQLNFMGYPASPVQIPATLDGSPILSPAVVCCGRPVLLGPLPVSGSGVTTYTVINQTGNVRCIIGYSGTQTYLKMVGSNGSCTIIGSKDGVTSEPLTLVTPSTI